MYRHISIFKLMDQPTNGKTKEENLTAIRAYLETIPEMLPTVAASTVGVNFTLMPPMPDDAPVMFGDLVQIIDFATREDCDAYAPSAAHGGLVALSDGAMKKVVGIDFEF